MPGNREDGPRGPAQAERRPTLRLQPLEPRLLLTTLVGIGVEETVTAWIEDASGDDLLLSFSAPIGATVDVYDTDGDDEFDGDEEDDIGLIVFTNTNADSQFSIMSDGGGGNSIVIAGGPTTEGIITDSTEDMGLIALGVPPDGGWAGEVYFGTDVGVSIGGSLGALLVSGELDFDDGGTFVTTGGNLGLLTCNEMTLDSSSGLADITVGPAGMGDLSMLVCMSVYVGTEGSSIVPLSATPGSPVTVADDAGDGTAGTLRFSVSSGYADVYVVPLVGGGAVVNAVDLDGDLTVQAGGAGGDLGAVFANNGDSSILLRGAADTDLGVAFAMGPSWTSIRNETTGGDIMWVMTEGTVGTVATASTGNVGAVLTGPGNSSFLFPQTNYFAFNGVQAQAIGTIQTGDVVNAWIHADSADTIDAGRGGFLNSYVEIDGDLGTLSGGFAQDLIVDVSGMGDLLQFDGLGVFSSVFLYLGGVTRAIFRCDMVDSDLLAVEQINEDAWIGGRIETFQAQNVTGCHIEAYDGFGSVTVSGLLADSLISAWFTDDWGDPSVNAGAGIDALSLQNVSDSDIRGFGDTTRLRAGTLGDECGIDIAGNLGSATFTGDLLDSYLEVWGSATGRVTVMGDVTDDSAGIYIGGSSGGVIVYGSLAVGGGIEIGGDVPLVVVRGGGSESSDIEIDGNAGLVRVGYLDNTDIDVGGSVRRIFVGYVGDGDTIEVDGDAGSIVIWRTSELGDIDVGGSLRSLYVGAVGGGAIDGDGDDLTVGGDLGCAVFASGLVEYNIEVEGDVSGASIHVNGSCVDLDVEVGGFLGRLVVNGDFTGADIEGDAGIGVVSIGGAMMDVEVASIDYDGYGDPIGGGMRSLQATQLQDIEIGLHGDLDSLSVRGLLDHVDIDTRAYDDYGEDDLVGGGGIGSIRGQAFADVDIDTFGPIGRISLNGSTGIDAESSIELHDPATGHLGSISTRGLIWCDIWVAGDSGSISSAGAAAIPPAFPLPSPLEPASLVDFLFVGPYGVPTGGSLAVDGTITGSIS
jgi:hypothetical protein